MIPHPGSTRPTDSKNNDKMPAHKIDDVQNPDSNSNSAVTPFHTNITIKTYNLPGIRGTTKGITSDSFDPDNDLINLTQDLYKRTTKFNIVKSDNTTVTELKNKTGNNILDQDIVYINSKGKYKDNNKIYNDTIPTPFTKQIITFKDNLKVEINNDKGDVNYIVSLEDHINAVYAVITNLLKLNTQPDKIIEILKRVLFVDHYCITQNGSYLPEIIYDAVNRINLGTHTYADPTFLDENKYSKIDDEHINISLIEPTHIKQHDDDVGNTLYNEQIIGNTTDVVIIPGCHETMRLLPDNTLKEIIKACTEYINSNNYSTVDALHGGNTDNNTKNRCFDMTEYVKNYEDKYNTHIIFSKCNIINNNKVNCTDHSYDINNLVVSPTNDFDNKNAKRIKEAYHNGLKIRNFYKLHPVDLKKTILNINNYLDFYMNPVDIFNNNKF